MARLTPNAHRPGYYFYAVIGTGEYGGVYIGNGQPNVDIQCAPA